MQTRPTQPPARPPTADWGGPRPSQPATATGAGTAPPRGLGPLGPPKPPCPGVPQDPAKPWEGIRPHGAGLGARRDGASVSRLLLRNADDSENAAFPSCSNAWPRITPAPSPRHPWASPPPHLAESRSCPWPAPALCGEGSTPPQNTGRLSCFGSRQIRRGKKAQPRERMRGEQEMPPQPCRLSSRAQLRPAAGSHRPDARAAARGIFHAKEGRGPEPPGRIPLAAAPGRARAG